MAPFGKTPDETKDGLQEPVLSHAMTNPSGKNPLAAGEETSAEDRRTAAAARAKALRAEKAKKAGQPVRAINEDDDGYDPYSDFHDNGSSKAVFERDPWL